MGFLIDALGWTVLHALWQGALVGAGGALILLTLRSAHPAVRYAVVGTALLACLIWPALDMGAQTRAAWSDSAESIVQRSLPPGQRMQARSAAADAALATMP